MHTIELFRSGGVWLADHSDPMIEELFGTSVLPTPFKASVDADVVVAQIEELNPEARVFARRIGEN